MIEAPKGDLNNAGDRVVLKNSDRTVIDSITYGSWDDGTISDNAPTASDPASIARTSDGVNSGNDKVNFRVTATPTRGQPNLITLSQESLTSEKNPAADVIISELLPNPTTRDELDEIVELYNQGSSEADITDWELVNSSGIRFRFRPDSGIPQRIAAQGYLVIRARQVGSRSKMRAVKPYGSIIPLRNGPIDSVSYRDPAPLGVSYSKAGPRFEWSELPTPGKENIITQKNKEPILVATFPSKGLVGQEIEFDASDSSDPEGERLSASWDFGDTMNAKGLYVKHRYEKEGPVHGVVHL